jgi:D-galactarolactone cycloisomerase
MSIAEIRLFHLVAPLPEVIGNAKVFFDARETLLVEVVDTSGLSGWGETWAAPLPAAAIIESQLAKVLFGQDPRHMGRLWHAMQAATNLGAISDMAVAALDLAIYDLAARLQQVPLSTVLGGALRDRVPAYASGPFFKPGGHPYRGFEREAESYLAAGFRAIKLRSGFDPVEDAATAAKIRQLIGPDAILMIDFNQAYTPRAALGAMRRMADLNVLWIEEPATPADIEGYRMLAAHAGPALAGGETFTRAREFMPFLAAGCMDVLQPDLALCGGFTGVARVADLGEIYARPTVPHVWGSSINLYAALHFATTRPLFPSGVGAPMPFLEYDMGPHPLIDCLGRPDLNADGTISVPDAPGLGISPQAHRFEPFVSSARTLSL